MTSFIEQLNKSLESINLRRYFISLFLAPRLSENDTAFQITTEPPGFDEAIEFAEKYSNMFPREVRKLGPGYYELSLRIEESKDSVERLALWAADLQTRKA
jgi:hypothetical protein